jgi:hypothetical protein
VRGSVSATSRACERGGDAGEPVVEVLPPNGKFPARPLPAQAASRLPRMKTAIMRIMVVPQARPAPQSVSTEIDRLALSGRPHRGKFRPQPFADLAFVAQKRNHPAATDYQDVDFRRRITVQ